jgi:hypothetical protein
MVEPELELGELAATAAAVRRLGGQGPRSGSAGTGDSAGGYSHIASSAGGAMRETLALGRADGGGQVPQSASQRALSGAETSLASKRPGRGQRARHSSSVMDDAREVAARRKRQLGWGSEQPGPGAQS